MGTVGLSSLALFAETKFTVGFHGEGGRDAPVGGEGAIAMFVGGAAGVCEDGGGIAPVQHKVEEDAGNGGGCACEDSQRGVDQTGDG